MHHGSLFAVIEALGEDSLAIAVRVEIDGSSRDDANKRRSESLEQRLRAFFRGDLPVKHLSSSVP